ncbi:MAG TPA: histidinol-phosphate transaminase [Clostridia bacterium]|nr:histidinol-phosphate transaminase [Clostridia bacterium]
MPFEINEKLKSMDPYEPVTGDFRIRLDANESFISPSEEVLDAIKEAIDALRFNRYPDPMARELCSLAADYYGVKPACVVAGNGSDELISVILNAFTQKGDKILTLSPDFSMYAFYSGLIECPCINMPKQDDFTIDIDAVIETVNKENVRIVIFSNPCNPTSIGLDSNQVKKLISSVDALVVLDEAYMDFFDQSLVKEVSAFDNLIVLRTLSKAMGMAAIRLGFSVANQTLTDAIRLAKSPYNVNAVSQAIGCAVLGHREYIQRSITRINASRDELLEQLKKLSKETGKITPIAADANFVFAKAVDAGELYADLMEAGILIRRFGDYVRITAGRNLENVELINAMERFYK